MARGKDSTRGVKHWYGWEDRLEQLGRIVLASENLVDLFTEEGQPGAGAYAALARAANEASKIEIEHWELKAVAQLLPERPLWLDPRNTQWNGPRGGWISNVAMRRFAAAESNIPIGCGLGAADVLQIVQRLVIRFRFVANEPQLMISCG